MNLSDAIKLYNLVQEYLVEPSEEETIEEYATSLYRRMSVSSDAVLNFLVLTTKLTKAQLLIMDGDELWKWWLEGLVESKILLLKKYLEVMSNG